MAFVRWQQHFLLHRSYELIGLTIKLSPLPNWRKLEKTRRWCGTDSAGSCETFSRCSLILDSVLNKLRQTTLVRLFAFVDIVQQLNADINKDKSITNTPSLYHWQCIAVVHNHRVFGGLLLYAGPDHYFDAHR